MNVINEIRGSIERNISLFKGSRMKPNIFLTAQLVFLPVATDSYNPVVEFQTNS